ncbi:MAG: low specificity L-threonine aldolase [Marinifilaceae bacterium]|jgi:threonine aldolase|nr:low specificity L-threonine aldolase [Marinifilaceae bacterium]
MGLKCFCSDNFSGVLPEVMKFLTDQNFGHEIPYGNDSFSKEMDIIFNEVFESTVDVYPVYNGSAANILSIASCISSYNSVLCSEFSHINTDECGALEKNIGCKIISIPTYDGKIKPQDIENYLVNFNNVHKSQPKLISISQSTELGTVYSKDEIKEICDLAHKYKLYVHVDGARIANALVYLDMSINELLVKTGVDVISFGGTKNGLMFGDAVVFLNTDLAKNFKYIRKQFLQLNSKSRFQALQFLSYFKNDLWLNAASHANEMAKLLAKEIVQIENITLTQIVEANEVFVRLPRKILDSDALDGFFYVWDRNSSEVRFVCSFDTTENDIMKLLELIRSNI